MFAAGAILSSCSTGTADNPLLKTWDTPFGIPPFEQVKVEHFMPAYLEAIKVHKAEIDAIINN